MFDKISSSSSARILLSLGAAVIAAAPICVHADSPYSPITLRVKFADLNPNTAEGAHRLYGRIERAAYDACGESKSDTPEMMHAAGPCVKDAIAHAVHSAGIQNLALVFIEKNGLDAAQRFDIRGDVRTAQN